jgi:hypothetical protein
MKGITTKFIFMVSCIYKFLRKYLQSIKTLIINIIPLQFLIIIKTIKDKSFTA